VPNTRIKAFYLKTKIVLFPYGSTPKVEHELKRDKNNLRDGVMFIFCIAQKTNQKTLG
jgi:hypothetical protein